MSKYQIEVHRRVYDNDNGHYLTVRPSPDFPDGNVEFSVEKSEEEWFGPMRLDMPAEMARKLGEALIAAASEAGE